MDLKAADERSSTAATAADFTSSSSTPIDSSNLGFKLLQKHGWKEGTGLGIFEQGRLEPVQAFIQTNKRGLGAEKPKRSTTKDRKDHDVEDDKLPKKKGAKGISKKMKKRQKLEEQQQEKEFDRAFFREFWPDNV